MRPKIKFLSIALSAAALLSAASAAQAADPAAGESIFNKRCKACHTIEPGKNKVGPSLFGVIGRQAGTIDGFKYSKSYVEAGKGGLTWSEDKVVEYLLDPKGYMREVTGDKKARSKMVFKLKDEGERQDVASYLATVK